MKTSQLFKTMVFAACFVLLLPTTTQAQDSEPKLTDLTRFTVKFGHDANFTEGVKKWTKCYKDNNGTDTWNMWHRLQGEENIYVVASDMENWAEMGKSDAAGKACQSVAQQFITPHVESRDDQNSRSMPEISRKAPNTDASVIWVYSFKVNNSSAFLEIVKDITSTIASKEGDNRGYWFQRISGEGTNYYVSTPFKDFAALDADTDNVWKVYESVHGKKKTEDTRNRFRATLDETSNYMYKLETELSKQ